MPNETYGANPQSPGLKVQEQNRSASNTEIVNDISASGTKDFEMIRKRFEKGLSLFGKGSFIYPLFIL